MRPLSLAPLDSSPKGRAKNAAEELLPPTLGEVATPKGVDGEGKPADGKRALSVSLSLDSSPKGRAKNVAEEPLPPTPGEVARRKP